MFQTEETEERLNKLEEVVHLIEEGIHDVRPTTYAIGRTEPRQKVACSTACGQQFSRGSDIAMDIMGSTNMGLCENTSDIDFVIYVRVILILKETSIPAINIKMPKRLSRKP